MFTGSVWRDLVYAGRALRRAPAFSLGVIAMLGLGIGANTAMFSVVYGVLLKPFPYEAPDRQVRFRVVTEARNGGAPEVRPLALSVSDTQALARASRALEHAGNVGLSLTNWRGREPRFAGAAITASVFPMLGVRPALGRWLAPEDELEHAAGAIVIGHRTWVRHFAGDRGALGQVITLEPALGGPAPPASYTIVGVAPAGFDYLPGSDAQYWIPLRRSQRGGVVARLAPGVTPGAAAAAIEPFLRSLDSQRSGPRPLGYEVVELRSQLVAPLQTALLMLMGAVTFVLLIACVNVANLVLARSLERRREVAIRKAIGASDGHIVRLMLFESLLLTGAAAVLAVALAAASARALPLLAWTMDRIDLGQGGGRLIPRLEDVGIDWTALAFTLVVAAAVAMSMGIIPALQQRRWRPLAALGRDGGIGPRERVRPATIRGAMMVAQVALSIILLVSAGLLIGSFVELLRVNNGYDPVRLLTFQVSLPSDTFPVARVRTFAEELVERIESTPGIAAAAYANQLPLVQLHDTLRVSTTPGAGPPGAQGADVRVVSRHYFGALRVAILAGRGFTAGDAAGQPRVLVVNEALARREFGGGASAVGRQVYVGADSAPWLVVGVVADVRQMALRTAPAPQFFMDARQWTQGLSPLFPLSPYYTVRVDGDDRAAIAAIRSALRSAEKDAVIFNLAWMEDIVSSTVARPRMYATLLGLFAAIGLTVALLGIYSVMAYNVSQRTREIGIRMALGARPALVLADVLRRALMLTTLGVAIGLLGATAVTSVLKSLLFGLTPLDVTTFTGVACLVTMAAALAAAVPARRASRIDPIAAMRAE